MVNIRASAVLGMALAAGSALGGTVDLNYTGVSGGTSAMHLRVAGVTYYAGHMTHVYTSGDRNGQTFNTFCIDVNEAATPGSATYQIIRLENAPLPGSPYGLVKAAAVSDVVANAIALGWIGTDLQANQAQTGYLGKMGAIQAAIWSALGFDVQVYASQTSSTLKTYYAQLTAAMAGNAQMSTAGLRAVSAPGQQDMLFIVPLPPAAFAGAGLLAVGFGVRAVRRRSN
jgi:hypothetical protein